MRTFFENFRGRVVDIDVPKCRTGCDDSHDEKESKQMFAEGFYSPADTQSKEGTSANREK